MRKINRIIIYILLIFFAISRAQEYPGFRVIGRHLYDKCGEKVILRGVNKMIIWTDIDGIPSYMEIAKTGANVVRIVWLTTGTASELDIAISNCIDNYMIPMIECHDATGEWDNLDMIVDYWTRPDIVSVIENHEEYLLLNIANECGDAQVPVDTFRTGYKDAILKMREAGIHVPLIIDGTDWGKNINVLQSQGPSLIDDDPDHNLIFSIHMWWPAMWGYSANTVINEIAESVNMELPLIVGEFGALWDTTAQGAIPYLTILEQCHLNEIGWIAWSWGPGNNPQTFLDMTEDGTFQTLHDWGLEVAITNSFSIANTSVRPYFILNGQCSGTAVKSNIDLINRTGFVLEQSFPNPFNLRTKISYEVFIPADITLEIYNIKGQKVRTLVNEWKSASSYTVYWNGLSDSGINVSSGIYFYQITVERGSDIFKKIYKLILLK